MLKIITSPDKVLLQKAEEVKSFDGKLKKILKEMEQTLLATFDPIGVGLAAPQVGLSLRIFLMKPTEKSKVTFFINPVFESMSDNAAIPQFTNSEKVENKKPDSSKDKLLEGCLSLPNIWGNVSRKSDVTMSWFDENGKKYTRKFTDFPAIIAQHEMDHLNGILFTKHVLEQGEQLFKSHKNSEGEDEFEEIKI